MRKRKFSCMMSLLLTLFFFFGTGRAQCPPDVAACFITVYCGDMVGDGWNGGVLQVWQDTVLRGSVSLTSGYEGEYDVPVCANDTMRFVWISGPLDYEITLAIANGDGSMILPEVIAGDFATGTIVAQAMPACPSCVRPVDLVCRPDSTYATITWTPLGTESSWSLYLNGAFYTTATAPIVYLSGLTLNTNYTVDVRAVCSGTDSSELISGSFRTTCPPLHLPYYNTFDGEAVGQLPSCWNPIITFGEAPKVTDEAAYSDSLSLFFGAEGWNVVATPLVPVPGNRINVSFRARLEDGIRLYPYDLYLFNSRLRAGVMTDLSDTSTFVSLVNTRLMDNNWYDYEFSTSELDSNARYYVAFFFKGSSYLFGNGFVDDLSITFDNGCHRPDYVLVDSVGSRCARLEWNAAGNNATGYYVYYSTENNPFNATLYTYVTDTSVLLWGLDQATTYYAWVRTACDEDSSEFRASAPFTTTMSCAPVSEVQLSNVHYSAAMVSWQYDYLNGSPSMGAWITLYDRQNPAAPVCDTVVSDNSVVFTGLEPSHCYTVYVRNLCQTGAASDTANGVPFEFMTNSCSEVSGNGQLSSSDYFVNTNMTNSYAQTLYLRDELSASDTIWGIAYHTSTGVNEPLRFSLYMANTSQTAIDVNSYIPADSLTPMTVNHVLAHSNAEWQVIYFDTPFINDTLRNLVVAVHYTNTRFVLSPSSWYYHPTPHKATVLWNSLASISMAAPSSIFGYSELRTAVDVRLLTDCSMDECTSPMVVGIVPDSSNIALSWVGGGDLAVDYVVQYKQASASTFVTAGTTSSLMYTIVGLSPATHYVVRVGTVCDADTLWNQVSATTACGSVHVPYTENFDSYASGSMPPCWKYNRRVVSHRYGGLYWQPATAVYGAVLPEFQYPVNRLEINFKAMLSPAYEGEGIMVGVTDDEGTFVDWLDTLSDFDQSLSQYTWFRYDFSDYQGTGTRMVLAHTAVGAEATLIDDITVLEAIGCLPASNIVALNLDNPSNIILSWNNPSHAAQWQLYWDTIGTNLLSMRNMVTVSDTFYALPPLTSGGKYTAYIRAICGSGQSAWRPIDFAAGTVIMAANHTDTVTGCGLVIYDDGGARHNYSNNNQSVLVVRPSDPTLSVRLDGGTVDLNPWDSDTLRIYEGEGTTGALLYQISSTYGPEPVDAVLVSEAGPMTIEFVSHNAATAAGYELYTSCVPAPPCRRPRNVSVTVLSATDAAVAWEGTGLSYDIKYRAEGTTVWNTVNVSTNTATLTSLIPGTTYDLIVRAYCAEGTSSPASVQVSFTTMCDAYTIAAGYPIQESFEAAEAPAPCFTLRSANGNPNAMVHSTEAAYAGGRSFRFSSNERTSDYSQYLISPLLNAQDSLTFRFRYSDMMFGQERLRVGYSISGSNPEDFTWTDTLTTNGIVWKLYKADFPSTTRFLAINYISNWRYYAFVDSLQISVVASADCQAPVIENITESTNSITVHFSASGTVEAYITDQAWNDRVSGVTVTGNSYTFTGLQPNTEYTIGLRSHCSSGISSHWATRTVVTSVENCPAPVDFSLVGTDYNSATFAWSGDAEAWEVNVYNTAHNISFTASESPFTATDLFSDVTYHARIRALCDGMPGNWCDTVITFTTALCEPVTDLESAVLDADSGRVLLTWRSDVGNYVLDYGEEHFSVGGGTTVTGITDERYQLTGLTPGLTYDYYVRAQCNDNTLSVYSERGTFTIRNQGIADVKAGLSAKLCPNPATGTTTLALSGVNGQMAVEVLDINGRTAQRSTLVCHEGCQMLLDLGALPQGVYFVRIAGPSVNMVEKLVVK